MGLNNLTTGAGTSRFTDIESDNITNSDTITSESVNPEFLADNHLFAGNFSGADADTRLSNALTAANQGDILNLEAVSYTTDQTISTKITIKGAGGGVSQIASGTTWTVTANAVTIAQLEARGTIDYQAGFGVIKDIRGPGQINFTTSGADNNRIYSIDRVSITFGSQSKGNLIDGCVRQNITDNGTGNLVGDVI
jgi:hypothetical protein